MPLATERISPLVCPILTPLPSLFQSTDVLRGSHGDILKRSYPELREAVSEVGFNGNANGDSMMFETCTNVSTAVGQQVRERGGGLGNYLGVHISLYEVA